MKNIFFCLIIFSPLFLSAQTATPEDALAKFAKYPQERIFIQFDKGEYLAGETMHFKAYVFSKLQLSRISTNLYFEFLDQNKRTIYRSMLPIALGISEGSFAISKALPENVYYIRAYTSWMLNFYEKFQFVQPINIYNPSSATRLVEQPLKWEATAHPEGGVLLDKILTKVAVRLRAANRLPEHVTAYLFENSEPTKKLTEVSFLNEEVGSFIFQPLFGKNYSIQISDDKNNTKVVSLVSVVQNGISLKTANSPNAINFQIASKGIEGNLKDYKIVADNQGELLYSAVIKNDNQQVNGSIPVDSVKGIVHITLFDTKGNVAAERLCFTNFESSTSAIPAISFTKKTSTERNVNEWNVDVDSIKPFTYTIEISDNKNSAINASYNLLNTYWLGDLVNPNFKSVYFNNNPAALAALDYLLMSEKWERYNWSDLLLHPTPKFKFFPDNYLSYEGSVVQSKRPVINENVNLVFQMADSTKSFVKVHTDGVGNFKIDNLFFRDTAKVYYKINSLSTSATNIDVQFKPIISALPYTGNLPSSSYTAVARKQNDTIPQRVKEYASNLQNFEKIEKGFQKLQDVVVSTKVKNAKDQLNKKLSSPLFNDPSQVMFDFVNEEQEIVAGVVDWMNGRVAGVTVDANQLVMRGQTMNIYIDEMQSDYTMLESIPTTEIALIKVLRTPFLLGSSAPVLAVYTKRAGLSKTDPNIAALHNNIIIGYPTVEKFKTIEYGEEIYNNTPHDTRSVLYWNTALNPEKGKETIKFYNNDISKKLRLFVIGFTRTGSPVFLDQEVTL